MYDCGYRISYIYIYVHVCIDYLSIDIVFVASLVVVRVLVHLRGGREAISTSVRARASFSSCLQLYFRLSRRAGVYTYGVAKQVPSGYSDAAADLDFV